MATLYNEYDKNLWFYQPNLVRWRHRFNGPRESQKLNQEMNQTYYDLNRLETLKDDLLDTWEGYLDLLIDGGDVDADLVWDPDATPSSEEITLLGLDEMAARVAVLKDQIERLEA